MTKTTEFTSITKARAIVKTILDNATNFNELLDELTELDERTGHFVILLLMGDDMGEGYDDDKWYIYIHNIRTDKEISFDVTDIVNKLD